MARRPKASRAAQQKAANRAWWIDLGICLGSLFLGVPLGILLEAAIRQGDPGPLTAALLVWAGQITVLWRYWRREPRPPMFRTSNMDEFQENSFYFGAHFLAIGIPVAIALVALAG